MNPDDWWDILITKLIPTVPQLLVSIVGCVLVFRRLRTTHPRAALWGTVGCLCLLLNALVGWVTRLYTTAHAANGSLREVASLLTLLNLLGFIFFTCAIICLGVAVLSDRATRQGVVSGGRVPVA